MNIDFKKKDSQVANLTVSIAKEDYLSQFEAEVKKQRGEAHLKGFRKGKTPLNYVKKLYGDQILANMVNEKAVTAIYDYLKENKIDTILDPIINEGEQIQGISYKDLKDYTFTFDVALTPEFAVSGISKDDEFVRFNVSPNEKELDENLEKIAKQVGDRITVKDSIEENDIVTVMADVLLTDAEGLTEPIEAEVKFLVSDTTESFRESLLKLKLNGSIKANWSEIEAKDEAFIKKYYLKMEDDDLRTYPDEADLSITNVERMKEMEIGEELFKKMYPEEEIKTVEEAKEKLKEQIQKDHLNLSDNILYRTVMDKMMDETKIELDDSFLLSWAQRAQVMKEGADEVKFLGFLKNDIKWNLIKGDLIKKYDVNITDEQIIERAKEQVKGYFGYKVAGNDPYIDMIAQNLVNDPEQKRKLVDEAITINMYKALEGELNIKIENKSVEEFYAIVEDINKKEKE